MHKFTSASAGRLIKRIRKRTLRPESLSEDETRKLAQIEQQVGDGMKPLGSDETFLIELAERVGA